MSKNEKGLDLRTATSEQIARAMTLGVVDALREHKRAGVPIVVWDREKDEIVLIPPDEIVIPDVPDEPADESATPVTGADPLARPSVASPENTDAVPPAS